jgi:hypothetical protein
VNKRFSSSAVCALLLAAATALNSTPATAGEPASCEIRVSEQDGMTALDAVLIAKGDLSGTFEFTVDSEGSGGTSTIEQGSDFSVQAGETTLGSASITGAYTAKLSVKHDGQTLGCEAKG